MGLKRVFGKIAEGFVAAGKAIIKVKDLPFLQDVVVFIPVVGPALAFALDRVEEAERIFSTPKSGREKFAWVLVNLQKDLDTLGLDEKRIGALIEIALLILKKEADITGR